MSKYQVIFFETSSGKCPVEEFINSLDVKLSAKLYRHSKHLDDGIFELRAKVGTNLSRVLYFFFSGHKIIVTNGFVKKTQKTPKGEIDKAKAYREEYKQREGL